MFGVFWFVAPYTLYAQLAVLPLANTDKHTVFG